MSNIKNLISNNQSIWLDSISKQMLDSGDLSKIIDLGITGITSNPSIFDKAISSSEVYDETIREISNNISDPKGVFEELAIRDIQRASDLLFKIYTGWYARRGSLLTKNKIKKSDAHQSFMFLMYVK